jgi:TPR repeat protein
MKRALRTAGPRVLAAAALALAGLAAAEARARPSVVAQLTLAPPVQPRIESAPTDTVRIEAASPRTPTIESRPRDDQPRIDAAPLSTQPLLEHDASAAAVDRELRRLTQAASASRQMGSTATSAQAAWQLGLIYLHGAGVRRDPALAQRWFEQAARYGREPWAYAGLAWCAIDGCVGPPDSAAAARAIALLKPRHPARAQYLEWVLATRQTPLQLATPGMAESAALPVGHRQLLEKAAAAGDAHANIELGIDAAGRERPGEAEAYFRRAGAQSPVAMANLQVLASRDARATGGSVRSAPPRDAEEALARARKYHRGEGVPANFSEAIRLYRVAEAQGSAEAHRMLALIYARPAPGGAINPGWMQQLAYVDVRTSLPTLGVPGGGAPVLQREPTPLYDLLPPFWRQRLTLVSR